MSVFFLTSGFKWTDPKSFDSNKYSSNSSTGCVLEVDFECPKKFHELHNDYLLIPEKIETKREMWSKCQLMILDFYNISIGSVKKSVSTFW